MLSVVGDGSCTLCVCYMFDVSVTFTHAYDPYVTHITIPANSYRALIKDNNMIALITGWCSASE